jgi:hypothetical protein
MSNTVPLEVCVSEVSICQSMSVDENDGRLVSKYSLKMLGEGAGVSLGSCDCNLKVYEVSKQGRAGASTGLGIVAQAADGLSITLFATREFIVGLTELVPECVSGAAKLTIHLQMRGTVEDNQIQGKLTIVSADYMIHKNLS